MKTTTPPRQSLLLIAAFSLAGYECFFPGESRANKIHVAPCNLVCQFHFTFANLYISSTSTGGNLIVLHATVQQTYAFPNPTAGWLNVKVPADMPLRIFNLHLIPKSV